MKNLRLWLMICLSICTFLFAPLSAAQQDSNGERKLVTRVEPDYPSVLRMR
jgi:hypothetical protein